jgi:prepilin-type N-terminal cleavage/methylation domain-containing protein
MREQQVQGYSLIEMLIVVALLALIAAAAAPSFVSDDEATLDQAADRVANAFRFAHSEAIRTGQSHGVIANVYSQFVKVYRLDDSVNPPVLVYDVRDPVTKQVYDLRLGGSSSEPAISTVYFKFDGFFFPQTLLGFSDTTGVPKYNDSGTIRMLENGYIRLSHESRTRTIAVSPMTARVTIQ